MYTMGKRLRFSWLFLFVFAIILFCPGCEEEEKILDQFTGERIGLVLNIPEYSDAFYYQAQLETALINYIDRNYDLEVVNPRLFLKRKPQWEGQLPEFCRDKLGLDYLLTIDLESVVINEPNPRMDLRAQSFKFKLITTCSLSLAYTFENLNTGGILYYGQSNGSSRKENEVKVGESGVRFDIEGPNYYDLIENAMFHALYRTGLL